MAQVAPGASVTRVEVTASNVRSSDVFINTTTFRQPALLARATPARCLDATS
jgi:hypothetical protein